MVFKVSSSLYLLNFAIEWTTVKIRKPSVVKSRNHGTFQDKRRMTRHSSCSNEWSLISLSFGLPGHQEVLTPLYFPERTVTWQKHNMLFFTYSSRKTILNIKLCLQSCSEKRGVGGGGGGVGTERLSLPHPRLGAAVEAALTSIGKQNKFNTEAARVSSILPGCVLFFMMIIWNRFLFCCRGDCLVFVFGFCFWFSRQSLTW